MTATSIGDLAQSFLLRHRNSALKQDMARLTQELATGQVADKRQTMAGNHNYLTQLERNIEVLAGYKVSLTEATIFADNKANGIPPPGCTLPPTKYKCLMLLLKLAWRKKAAN